MAAGNKVSNDGEQPLTEMRQSTNLPQDPGHTSMNAPHFNTYGTRADGQPGDGVLLDFWWPAGSLDSLNNLPDDFDQGCSSAPPGGFNNYYS